MEAVGSYNYYERKFYEKEVTMTKNLILNFLNGLTKEGITKIDYDELVNYIAAVLRDSRFSELTRIRIPHKTTFDDGNSFSFSKMAVADIEKSFYTIPMYNQDKKVLMLNKEGLNQHVNLFDEFDSKQQDILDKIVNNWKVYKEQPNIRVEKRGIDIQYYNTNPNRTYAICTDRRHGIFGIFNGLIAKDKPIRSWDLFTDGNVVADRLCLEASANFHEYSFENPEREGLPGFKAKASRFVSVRDSDWVGISGKVNGNLKRLDVYGHLTDKDIEEISHLVEDPSKFTTIAAHVPAVKVLTPQTNKTKRVGFYS